MADGIIYRWANGQEQRVGADGSVRFLAVELFSGDGEEILERYTVGDTAVLRGGNGSESERIIEIIALFEEPGGKKCFSAVPLCHPSVFSDKFRTNATKKHGIDLTDNILLDERDVTGAAAALLSVPVAHLLRPCAVRFQTSVDDPLRCALFASRRCSSSIDVLCPLSEWMLRPTRVRCCAGTPTMVHEPSLTSVAVLYSPFPHELYFKFWQVQGAPQPRQAVVSQDAWAGPRGRRKGTGAVPQALRPRAWLHVTA